MNSRIRQFLREEWVQLLLLILPFVAVLIASPHAQGPVPIHWNLNGRADGFLPSSWGLFLTPALTALVVLLVFFFEKRDRYRLKENGLPTAHGKAVHSIRIAISILFAGICLLQIAWVLGHKPESAKLIPCALALLFAFIGNFFGKLQPNKYVGIRVPWTLNSAYVWRQTHRMAGWIWTGGGLLFALMVWLLPLQFLALLTIAWLSVLIGVPLIFAWNCSRQEQLGE